MRLLLGLPVRRVEGFQANCKRQGYKVAPAQHRIGGSVQGRDFGIVRVWG
jgi:hypothetical protein